MSVRVMALVWNVPLDPSSKMVLLAMADHANDEGKGIYPGNKRLCLKAGLSLRQLQYDLAHLEGHGLIRREKYACGGRGRAVEWSINTHSLELYKTVQSAAPFDVNRAICSKKGCNLGPETVQCIAPQPSGTIMNRAEDLPEIQIRPGETPSQALRRSLQA